MPLPSSSSGLKGFTMSTVAGLRSIVVPVAARWQERRRLDSVLCATRIGTEQAGCPACLRTSARATLTAGSTPGLRRPARPDTVPRNAKLQHQVPVNVSDFRLRRSIGRESIGTIIPLPNLWFRYHESIMALKSRVFIPYCLGGQRLSLQPNARKCSSASQKPAISSIAPLMGSRPSNFNIVRTRAAGR